MPKFIIRQEDPLPYRERILAFWEKYLPGTPPGRFDWLNRGNPAGPAIWYFALNRESDELAGVISVVPREIVLEGQATKAGILGDFMVNEKYRVFGPNIDLSKKALSDGPRVGFRFFYTIPNRTSSEIMSRVGFRKCAVLGHFVKPVRVKSYLEKHVTPGLASLLASPMDLGLRLISKGSYISGRGFFEEVTAIDESFDNLWRRVRKSTSTPVGDHSSGYLRWKYLQNPTYPCRIISFRRESQDPLEGYLAFTLQGEAMEILDLVFSEREAMEKLLKKAIQIGFRGGCKAIYFTISSHASLVREIRRFGFLKGSDDISLLGYGEGLEAMVNWNFMAGDRNL
jgi:hypothetical protein